ncbi:DUF4225 domain-containing protein [Enterobacter cloacae]|uniref:DUF4225 domain-containing protein n=1 Tax=Enterobacter cloacae TaxID=550 RepID=UPI000484EA48|nr:DUF4225 domain-containing protein [Enterobacter cloacae]MBD9067218.1 DUF4225 domain-containing protein [Enterobacter cloacae]MCU6302435.1 DUF4225 domain-containing protein [Enterobacter cloacae]MDW3563037.1 DUF4225 domain-containing protein [Enterobacter cloacae]MEA5224149.1 DUF4225 domain-containing protein [Enterobacter cloacae]PAN77713.1 DUF4225 domain-containing protein [Enterobacter cloacae]
MYNHNRDKNRFEHKVREIELLTEQISAKHLFYGTSGLFFEIQQLVGHLKREIESHCLTFLGGTQILDEQIRHLREQDDLLTFNRAKMFIVVEKNQATTTTIALKQIGFVAGGAQVYGGASLCVGSLGLACAAYGAPMIAHGLNNVYENGYYLLFREEQSGTVREAYRFAATKLGYGNNQADLIYGVIDLSLSAYGAGRKVLASREKSWSLFHNIQSDYIRGWQEASKTAITLDATSSSITGWQMYQIAKEN